MLGNDVELALGGGEDYELLFCLKHGHSEAKLSRYLGVPVRRIGRILPKSRGLKLRGPDGISRPPSGAGWNHLGARDRRSN